MTKISSETFDASASLGSFTSYVDSKKGACTPVRRSRRFEKGISFEKTLTPHPKKTKSRMAHEPKVAVADGGIRGDKENSSSLQRNTSVDDLCTLFQTTCSVDNVNLEVQSSETNILSPVPNEGRYVTAMKGSSEGVVTPVKRSTRFLDQYATSMKEISEGVLTPVKSSRF